MASSGKIHPTETDIIRQLAEAGLRPPKAVTLAITNRCNLACRHCWSGSLPDETAPVVPEKQVTRLIEDFAALGAEKLVITGGEPLLHPDWFSLLSFACTRPGVKEVRLQTNAILLTPEHVRSLSALTDRGLIVQTSLEGATPHEHDRVRGAGSFAGTIQGLRLLVKAGMASRICITFTEMRHNFEELPDLLMMVDEMGVGQFITGTLVSGGRARQADDLAPPTPEQYEKLLARYQSDDAFRSRYQRMGNIAALEWTRQTAAAGGTCCAFIETPYVTAEGRLYPCVMLHATEFAVSDVYRRPLLKAMALKIDQWAQLQDIKRSRLTRLDACKSCPYYPACGGGCLGRAYAAHNDLLAAEDRCVLRKAIYGSRIKDHHKEVCHLFNPNKPQSYP